MAERQPIALVVDDEPDICDLISMTLRRMDVRTDIAMSVAEAHRRLSEKQYDFCLTDMHLPDGDGLQLVEQIQDRPQDQALPVAVITAHGNMDTAISALKLGAFDFVSKPVDLERLRTLVQLALRLNEDRDIEQQEFPPLLQGQSPAIQNLRTQIDKIARSDAPVHIHGEPGSGKELTARSIHQQGPRASKTFVTLHCAATPAERLEKALFGINTATDKTDGAFHTANGGTLLLDEITELPQELQVKLLAAIQEKRFYPVGSAEFIELDIRILSASHKNLVSEVRNGRFRSDLFYRINVIEVAVPALRARLDDIPLLTRNLLRRLTADNKGGPPRAAQDAVSALQTYDFPGNLRELENILERALTLCESNTLRAGDLLLYTDSPIPPVSQPSQLPASESAYLPPRHQTKEPPCIDIADAASPNRYPGQFSASEYDTLDDFLQTIEREAIESALNETRWNRTAAAEKLGISFRSLRYRLKKLNLED